VVPEAIEGSLMLASHALALVGVPMRRVIRIVQDQRDARYNLLRGYFHGADDDTVNEREQERLLHRHWLPNGPPSAGKLVANMAAAGLKPDDIDTIILSHYHGDHINGIRNKAGQLVFPKARIMVPAPEHAFWMDDARMEAAPPAMKGAFQNVRRVLAGLPADQLVRFEPGAEVAPGITSVAAFGHTPGHTLFTVKSEGQSFAYVADLTNVPSLFARSPDWSVTFDMDKEMARATRRKIFDMIVKDKMMAGGFHFPFPAFGSIEAAGNGYQFKPLA
jgi:glyoxylase-like metal-dependent hydrolase (beta-lactamase superfamily II)